MLPQELPNTHSDIQSPQGSCWYWNATWCLQGPKGALELAIPEIVEIEQVRLRQEVQVNFGLHAVTPLVLLCKQFTVSAARGRVTSIQDRGQQEGK